MLPAILARKTPKRSYDAVGKSALNIKVTPRSTLLPISQTKPTAWLQGTSCFVQTTVWFRSKTNENCFMERRSHQILQSCGTDMWKTYNWLTIKAVENYLCRGNDHGNFTVHLGLTLSARQTNRSDSPTVRVCACLLHTGHSRCLWQLPEGGFMMTALILSCESTSVLDDFPNMSRARPQGIVPGPLENSYLRGLTRYCSMKAIFFCL